MYSKDLYIIFKLAFNLKYQTLNKDLGTCECHLTFEGTLRCNISNFSFKDTLV